MREIRQSGSVRGVLRFEGTEQFPLCLQPIIYVVAVNSSAIEECLVCAPLNLFTLKSGDLTKQLLDPPFIRNCAFRKMLLRLPGHLCSFAISMGIRK
jgi:hypothetical protein